jgi:hypothetical protein
MRRSRARSLFDATHDQHREAAGTAPRNSRVPGSPEWCYQTMGLLKSSYRHIHIDQEHFTHYLNELREHRAWEKVPVDHPYGSEEKMLVAELGKRVDEIRAELDAAKQDLDAQKNKALDAATPDLKDVGHPSSKGDTKKNDVTIGTGQRGNSDEYAMAKLRDAAKDDERIAAIYQRVLDGLSPNAGMVEAGFRKKRASRKMTMVERLLKLWDKASNDERAAFRAKIDD